MNIKKDIYLGHFGVKGMRWGVHNKAKTSKFDKYDVRQQYRDYYVKRAQQRVDYNKNNSRVSRTVTNRDNKRLDKAIRWQKGKPTKSDKTVRNLKIATVVGVSAYVVGSKFTKNYMTNKNNKAIAKAKYNTLLKDRSAVLQKTMQEGRKKQLSIIEDLRSKGKIVPKTTKAMKKDVNGQYDRLEAIRVHLYNKL